MKTPASQGKSIHRVHRPANFVTLPNALLQDASLSYRSRGIAACMLSMPETWITHQCWIQQHGTEGEDAIRTSIRELEAAGYLTRHQLKKNGKLAGVSWNWYATPIPVAERTSFGQSPKLGFPRPGNPSLGNASPIKYPSEKRRIGERTESKETEGTAPHGAAHSPDVFVSTWKPKQGTKAEKLARVRQPAEYPSEAEFDDFLEREGLDFIITYRSELYRELCVNKWHQWKETPKKWVPIRDWTKFVTTLDGVIQGTHA